MWGICWSMYLLHSSLSGVALVLVFYIWCHPPQAAKPILSSFGSLIAFPGQKGCFDKVIKICIWGHLPNKKPIPSSQSSLIAFQGQKGRFDKGIKICIWCRLPN